MEKLELKHIAPYLPYKLKARCDKETYHQAEKDRIGVIDYWDGESVNLYSVQCLICTNPFSPKIIFLLLN